MKDVKIVYNMNLEEMLLRIPAGPERERAAIILDESLGIPHIPTEGYEKAAIASGASPVGSDAEGGDDVFSATVKKKPKSGLIDSKINPLKTGTFGMMGKLDPGALQVGVSSWVGKKLYHGFRGGYFDAKSYDPDFNHEDSGGENTYGFWATPSFAFAQTFGKKGGVVEVFMDVKRALTFNLEALSWVSTDWIQQLLKVAKIDITPLKDSRLLYERLAYNQLMGLDTQGNPYPGKPQMYVVLESMWSLLKGAGYDGICLPEKGVPTVAALDFSQVTYGKRVKTGGESTSWDEYDVGHIDGLPPKAPSKGPVVLTAPKAVSPAVPKEADSLTAPKLVPPVKKAIPKPRASQPAKPVSAPKSITDGPDPRFEEGELFASWRRKGYAVTPLFSGQGRGIISRRFIRSSPDNESWKLFESGIDSRLEVFCNSLSVRLSSVLGFAVSVSWGKEFLRLNYNIHCWVDVEVGGETQRVIRLVGNKTNFDYQVSVFGVKVEGFVRSEFLNNSLVSDVVAHFTGGGE
jgi:hypothetical protein